MSLRDQLLAKGIVKQKDAKRIERELKDERKAQQGARDRKHRIEAEERAKAEAETQRRTEERNQARKAAEIERERHELAVRVQNIIVGNRQKNTGPFVFHFKARDGRTVLRMGVHRRVAEALRDGRMGIACLDRGTHDEYVLLSGSGAQKLADVAPGLLVHFAQGPVAPGDGVYERDWEPTMLRPGGAPRRQRG